MHRRAFRALAVAGSVAIGLAAAPLAGRAATDPTFTATRGVMTSFDGTPIVYNLFEPAGASPSHRVPVILRTHGWGGSGEQADGLSGTSKALLGADYAVLTWDERGFGQSGGDANIDDPNIEGRDASALIDLLAARPEIAQNRPGDPIVGMSGGSYAGGIQLALAAFDKRVDAIAPEITWNDLRYSLFPHNVIKFGWDSLLYGAGLATAASGGLGPSGTAGIQTGSYAPGIHEAEVKGVALGEPDGDTLNYFGEKSMAVYGAEHPVKVPTLLMQGSVDTLFNLNDAWANYQAVKAAGAPVKLIAFCGGHVSCPSDYTSDNARAHLDQAILTWFAKYLRHGKGNTGAAVEYSTQDGAWHTTSTFPTVRVPGSSQLVKASGTGTAVSTGLPTSTGPSGGTNTVVTDGPSGGQPDTVTIAVLDTGDRGRLVVGLPHVDLDVTGTGLGAHLFFKLVDREANRVLDLQAESLRISEPLSVPQHFSLDLAGVTYLVPAGHHLDLQISTGSLAHVEYRGPASVDIAATVPVPPSPASR